MLTVIFVILMILVFGNLIWAAIKLTWGITKVVFGIILLPIVLIGMVLFGLIQFALPILIIIGIVSLILRATSRL